MTAAAIPPRSPGNNWAYWKVNDLRVPALTVAFKRRRRNIDFIPTEDALARSRSKHICPVCKQAVTAFDASRSGKGVRGEWSIKHKRFVLMHYICSWELLLRDVFALSERMF